MRAQQDGNLGYCGLEETLTSVRHEMRKCEPGIELVEPESWSSAGPRGPPSKKFG
jgi:hypothetical protein